MKTVFVGIAGGSGAGKSTVSFALADKYPRKVAILHFDDYLKMSETVPVVQGRRNLDHPDSLDWTKLLRDINDLKKGRSITVQTHDEHLNPNYKQTGRIPARIEPKPLIILEGFLVLFHPKIRKMLKHSIFLTAEHNLRLMRRTKPKDAEYVNLILNPMHEQFVEPTKRHAEYVINTSNLDGKQVLQKIEELIGLLRK